MPKGESNRFDRVNEMVEELLEREQQYSVFLDASPWGILVVDQTFHIVFVNKTMERMSGYSINELIGRHMHLLLPKEDRAVHIRHETEYIKKPYDRVGNHGLNPRLLCKNGAALEVEISISPTRIEGKGMFFASIRDRNSLYNTIKP